MKHILALDPAKVTGWAQTGDQCGVWNFADLGRNRALLELRDSIRIRYQMDTFHLIAFEEASLGSHNGHTSAMHSERAGVIRLCAIEWDIPVVTYNPMAIKVFATGNGKVPKSQIVRACQTQFGFTPADDNVADARFILEMATRGVPGCEQTKGRGPKPRRGKAKAGRLF